MVMKDKNLILKKCLLSVIMFATYFPNGSGKEREREIKLNKANVTKC